MPTTTDLLRRTGWEDTTASADTLELAALRAMADRAVTWARAAGGRWQRAEGTVLADARSAIPFLNLALSSLPLDVSTAKDACTFFPAERPLLLISPHPTPDLTGAGLELMGHPPFMIRPAGEPAPARPAGLTVSEVRDQATLHIWARVLAAGYPTPPSPGPSALLGGSTRFWLARHDGEPAATALSHTAHGVVTVEAVATLPAHRGRGAGGAVTWAATTAAELPAVLIASDDGVGIYRRLGFLPITRWTLWIRRV